MILLKRFTLCVWDFSTSSDVYSLCNRRKKQSTVTHVAFLTVTVRSRNYQYMTLVIAIW